MNDFNNVLMNTFSQSVTIYILFIIAKYLIIWLALSLAIKYGVKWALIEYANTKNNQKYKSLQAEQDKAEIEDWQKPLFK